ncbi:MAG: M28 family metallopeptidase [Bacteroidales bacterium]|jgi:Zn-dependent M28 family amino/carboxypeptidase|nr:M28 family metallopeptidase [Bacteroidales bacterium]
MHHLTRAFILIILLVLAAGCQKDPIEERDEFVSDMAAAVRADSLESYVRWLEDMGTRFALADNHREVARQIKARFIAFGYPDTKLDSFSLTSTYRGTTYTTLQYNVIATLQGSSSDSVSVIGAHYDNIVSIGDPFAIVPGANDNASGVAAALEIARLMKKFRFKPKYTIRFVAFGAEELGLHGSRDYAAKAAANGDNMVMMLNHDMIAYLTNPGLTPWYVNIIHYDNSVGLKNDAVRLCAVNTSLVSYTDNTNYKRSDSYPFFMYGYKPLFFHQSEPGSTYHTASDLTSGCNFEYCREIVKVSCSMLVEKNY